MTGLIAIDESGDLGSSGTEFFTIAAIIMLRPRNLKKAADLIPKKGYEVKWHNSDSKTKNEIINALSDLSFKIVYCTVNKNNPDDHRPVYGNELYERTLKEVIADSFKVLPCRDVNVVIDGCSFIDTEKIREIVLEEAEIQDVNPKKVYKAVSHQNKCIQLADFVAGAVRAESEYSDELFKKLSEKVSVVRRH